MCLVKIEKIPDDLPVVGYKVFALQPNGDLRSPCMDRFINRPKGKWITDQNNNNISEDCTNYPCGFHIFLKKDDAVFFKGSSSTGEVIRTVKFRKVVAAGWQMRSDCEMTVVARGMYILPEGSTT